jgi:hypothetical protein
VAEVSVLEEAEAEVVGLDQNKLGSDILSNGSIYGLSLNYHDLLFFQKEKIPRNGM